MHEITARFHRLPPYTAPKNETIEYGENYPIECEPAAQIAPMFVASWSSLLVAKALVPWNFAVRVTRSTGRCRPPGVRDFRHRASLDAEILLSFVGWDPEFLGAVGHNWPRKVPVVGGSH